MPWRKRPGTGRLRVAAEVRIGICFNPRGVPATTSHEPPTPRVQVLIAATDPARTALAEAVKRLGYTVCHAAEPGPKAVDLPEGASPDLALIGLEDEAVEVALETAGRVAERFDAPIVFVTGTTNAALLERAQHTRPYGYVLWQADPRQLDLTIRAALGSHEARARSIGAELHERVQVLDAMIRSMGDGVVVTDAQLRITLANPSARRILGSDLPDDIPDEWADDTGLYYLDRKTRVPREETPSARAVRGETIEDLVLFVRSPSIPEGVHISVNASPLRDEAHRIAGSVAVFRDVSARKMQEEALLQAFAHGRLEVIDTLQHNIGNAINSVATGVDTLHEWLEDNELVRRFDVLAGLVREHERDWIPWLAHDDQGRRIRPFLLALISDLTREQRSLWNTTTRVRERVRHIVDIIRAQAAFTNGAVERQAIDLAQTLADAVTVVQEGLGRRSVEIEVDCSRAPGRLLVQEGRFQQLLVNLLINALEATDERAARLGTDGWRPRVRLSAYRASEEGMLAIDVIDNGIGLEASQLPSVFAAGYTTKKDGTGLGLHTAANFVIGSGGSIRPLSDGIGRGTTMRVTLRLSEPGPEEPASDGGEEPRRR